MKPVLIAQRRRGRGGHWLIGCDRQGREWLRRGRGWRRVIEWRTCSLCETRFPRVTGYDDQVLCSRHCSGRFGQLQIAPADRAARARAARACQVEDGWQRLFARCRLQPTEERRLKAAFYYGYNAHKSAAYRARRRQQLPVRPRRVA